MTVIRYFANNVRNYLRISKKRRTFAPGFERLSCDCQTADADRQTTALRAIRLI